MKEEVSCSALESNSLKGSSRTEQLAFIVIFRMPLREDWSTGVLGSGLLLACSMSYSFILPPEEESELQELVLLTYDMGICISREEVVLGLSIEVMWTSPRSVSKGVQVLCGLGVLLRVEMLLLTLFGDVFTESSGVD